MLGQTNSKNCLPVSSYQSLRHQNHGYSEPINEKQILVKFTCLFMSSRRLDMREEQEVKSPSSLVFRTSLELASCRLPGECLGRFLIVMYP